MTQRIVEMVFMWVNGDKDAVVNWLKSLGCKIASNKHNEVILDGLTGVRVGLSIPLDPVSTAVQFGFALAGQFWPMVYPDLLKEVNKQWKYEKNKNTTKKTN